MIRNWEDMDKTIVTLTAAELGKEAAMQAQAVAERNEAAVLRR
jgi:hypothetical protein